MAIVIIAIISLIAIGVAVKLYDEQIRASRYGKSIVVYATLLSLITIIYKFVKFIFGG